ncbi:MAG: YqeG family HAD IIIA-type phosphatase [Clostridia bacterium]|nr:YqeG family HAD IIIA-type phosphatase [Clostridia bacterium]
MLFEKYLIPDYMFERYDEITPAFLASIGVRALLIDIDNTLAPYEQPDPDERNFAWVAAMREAGVGLTFVSNNHRARVERFAAPLGIPAYWDAGKPMRKTLDIAMAALGSGVEDTAMLGDQLLTDAYAGKHIGLRTLIVPPIRDKRSLFVRAKRWIERPYIRKYRRMH